MTKSLVPYLSQLKTDLVPVTPRLLLETHVPLLSSRPLRSHRIYGNQLHQILLPSHHR